ncbi:hypothetical protein Golob_015444 [Gossypium lobatum]|uniref:DUF4283 domain-containing protein n=1 Tax=Gossypium lobatum TaxID=34289 RepID=A0A7J8M141_9ROSI|nr:hypothetical protein [Gossypium lobatum]
MGGDECNQVEKWKKSYRDSLLGSNLENLRQVVLQEGVDSMEIEAPSDDGEDSLEETLATKVFGNYQFLKQKLVQLWNPLGIMKIIDLGCDFFLINLNTEEDYDNVFWGGPWLIGGKFITVRIWTPEFRASEAKLDKVAIWVQLIELQIEYYDSGILHKIGTSIGKLVKVDNYILAWRNYASPVGELVMGGNIVLKPKQQRPWRREKKDESLKLRLAVEDGFGSWLLIQSKRQNREVSSPDQVHRKWEVAHSSNSKSVVLNYDKTKQSVVLPNAGKKVEKVQMEDTQNMGTVKGHLWGKSNTSRPRPCDGSKVSNVDKTYFLLFMVALIDWTLHGKVTLFRPKLIISIRKKLTLEPTLENGSEGGPKEVATGKFLEKSLRLGDKVEICKRDDDRMDGREQSNPGPTILHHEGNAVERDKEDSKLGTSKATAISVLSRAISSREKFKRKHQTKEVTSSGREALSADPHLVATYLAISSMALRSIGTYEPEILEQRKGGTMDYGDSTVPSRGGTFGVSPYGPKLHCVRVESEPTNPTVPNLSTAFKVQGQIEFHEQSGDEALVQSQLDKGL